MKEILGKLQATKNYSLFELLGFNRDTVRLSYLRASMRKHGWIDAYPMHVVRMGKELKIKDGHHRFVVAQELGIAVKYIVCEDDATVYELQKGSIPWNTRQFATGYLREGGEDYAIVRDFCDETGISLSSAIKLFGDYTVASLLEKFRSGDFRVVDTGHAGKVADLVGHLRQIGIDWAANTGLVDALSLVVDIPEVDIKILKQRLSSAGSSIKKQATQAGYVEMLEAIYNRRTRDENRTPLVFLAGEVARRRKIAKKNSQK